MSRAAALVTDRGGITGHLANVAREFGIPALFNTGEATARLAPGQLVTVDADGLAVYEGRVEELLALAGPKEGLMAGTPVGETLKEVMTLITPLNLTNPEAPDFSPKGAAPSMILRVSPTKFPSRRCSPLTRHRPSPDISSRNW